MIPALPRVEHLRGALSDKRCAARADRLAIRAAPGSVNMDCEELEAIFAVAQLVLLIDVITAPGADEKTQSPWMIHIKPVTARPAFIYLNIVMTVIDHLTKTTFVTYHLPPPMWRAAILAALAFNNCRQTTLLIFL